MDGITYLCPRKDVNKVNKVKEEMTNLTGLYIEDNIYTKFVVRDVNNYLAVYESGDVKLKGCFEVDKEFHKDPSMRIVPYALKRYYINGDKIEDTIRNHTDIYDFCLRLKTNSKSKPFFTYYNRETQQFVRQPLDRTTRYYISKGGGTLSKDFSKEELDEIINYWEDEIK